MAKVKGYAWWPNTTPEEQRILQKVQELSSSQRGVIRGVLSPHGPLFADIRHLVNNGHFKEALRTLELVEDLRSDDVKFVYFADAEEEGLVKIGKGTHPVHRCRRIGVECNVDVSLLTVLPVAEHLAFALEHRLHEFFADHHFFREGLVYQKEWFQRAPVVDWLTQQGVV